MWYRRSLQQIEKLSARGASNVRSFNQLKTEREKDSQRERDQERAKEREPERGKPERGRERMRP